MSQLKKLEKLIFATFGLYLKNLINYNIHRRELAITRFLQNTCSFEMHASYWEKFKTFGRKNAKNLPFLVKKSLK